jgi:hypothetical protein
MRHYARHTWKGRVKVISNDGVALFGVARDISIEGVQLIFDQASAKHLVPCGFQLDPRDPVEVKAVVSLRNQHILEVPCMIRNVRRLAQDAFSFHLEFSRLIERDIDLLARFVESLPTVA